MEKRNFPPAHPGRILRRHYVEPLGLSQQSLADNLKVSRKTVNKIICERGAVTADMALRLARALGTTPELWLNLQRNYDLWHAENGAQEWRSVQAIQRAGDATALT